MHGKGKYSCLQTYLPPEEGAELTDVPDDDVHAISELCDGLKQGNVTVSTPHTGNWDRVWQATLTPADRAKPHGRSNHLLLSLGGEEDITMIFPNAFSITLVQSDRCQNVCRVFHDKVPDR